MEWFYILKEEKTISENNEEFKIPDIPVNEEEEDIMETEEQEDIFDTSKDRIEQIYQEAKEKIKDYTDPDTIQDILNKAKEQSIQVLSNVKEAISSNEKINSFVSSSAESIKNNESIQSFIDKSSKKIDDFRQSETLKKTIDKAEDVSDKLHDVIFNNLRKIIKEDKE